ncbi:3634_t:CDS:1 [Funneliformis geosporum]|uniref:DNA polymerase delta subunit 3 n=1 Tax=Funneliformis geosporum TaxID=1117311 RepID=A0A9W4SWE9_9GLOM|nr:11398_t:CDS:1 [Funneliformis geosporum]CAI2181639.1 3634_t:CDS:1 [Funneliformis geosporum]
MTIIEQLEIIKQLVLKERKIVTYEWLSKYLNIHVNEAKPLLYKFISKYGPSNKESFYTVYCISGIATINEQHTVTLIYQDNLENIRKDFSKISSLHVYSVQPECPTEAELVKANQGSIDKVSTEPALPSNTKRDDYSNEKKSSNNFIKPDEKESVKVKPTRPETSKSIKSAFSKEKQLINKQTDDKTSDISSLICKTSHDVDTSKFEREDKQSEGKQLVNQQKSDKTEDIFSRDESKTSNKKSKKRKSDECESNLDEASKEERVNNKQKSCKENKVTNKNKIAKSRKKNKVADDLDLQNVTEEFMTIDIAEKDQPQEKQSVASASPDQQNVLPTKKRGRRQTLKFRSYVNEKGYTVRENYHEWESFSEDETVSEPPAKKSQKVIKAQEPNVVAKRSKKKKGDDGSQKSLLSFFGKK